MKAIRWSDNDRYYGPFTYARDRRGYRPTAIMLGSGDDDDYPGCRLRISGFGHTLIVALPAIIKPHRRWVDTSRYHWSGPGQGYWDVHEREYGFTASEGSLHIHYGPQTNEWPGDAVKVWFYPWRCWRLVRHSLYDDQGDWFADLEPRWKLGDGSWERRREAIDRCPTRTFAFKDYDGEEIEAVTRIEERESLRGEGRWKWLSWFSKPIVRRVLELSFTKEVGKRKGSWKGGTVGHSIEMKPGEGHAAAFYRYCGQNQMTFIGEREREDA